VGFVLASALRPGRALAQATPPGRETSENTNLWLTLNGEYEVRRRWFADYELNLRFSGPLREKMQFIPRLSVRYQPRSDLRFNWGYNFAETWPYGSAPVALRFPEHRLWQQVQYTHPVSRLTVSHRYRLEQRWTGRTARVGDDVQVSHWVRTNRLRYRVQGILPLPGPTFTTRRIYTNASAEAMVQWGANVQGNTFDQYRLIWLVGRRPPGGMRMETGYMQQVVLRGNGRSIERNHTIMFTLFPSRLLAPPAPAAPR